MRRFLWVFHAEKPSRNNHWSVLMDQLISPVFVPGNLPHNASELRGFFFLERERDVPVAGFTIVSDGYQQRFAVADGRYHATALWLLYQMARDGHHEFDLSDDMHADLVPYYGPEAVSDAAGEHGALTALLGDKVHVSLVLNPGYEECLVTSRPVREVIQNAWWRRESIDPTGRNSFLSRAIDMLFAAIDAGKICMTETDADGWPSMDWCDRALDLQQRLTNEPIPA